MVTNMPTVSSNIGSGIALLTAAEYGRLPDVPGFRDELIEGERILSPFAKAAHSAVIKQLERMLEAQQDTLAEGPVVLRESGLYLNVEGIDSVPGPDLMVLREQDYQVSIHKGNWFEGTPLFVIEVISPSERKSQRLRKVGLYLDAGIPTVVEVDYTKRVAFVHTLDGTTMVHTEQITAPFRVQLSDVFCILD
jgi:Uma2 family endonuclease